MNQNKRLLLPAIKLLHEFLFLWCMTVFIYLLKGGTSPYILGTSLLMFPASIVFTWAEEKIEAAAPFLIVEAVTVLLCCVAVRGTISRTTVFLILLILFAFSLYAKVRRVDNPLSIPHIHGLIIILLTSIIARALSLRSVIICCYLAGSFYILLFLIHRILTRRDAFYRATTGILNADTCNVDRTLSHTAMRSFLTAFAIIMLLGFYKLVYPDISSLLEPAYTFLIETITDFFDEDIPEQEQIYEPSEEEEEQLTDTQISETYQPPVILKAIYFIAGGVLLAALFFLLVYLMRKLYARLGKPKQTVDTKVEEHLISEEHMDLKREKKKHLSYKERHTTANRIRLLYKSAIEKNRKPNETLLASFTPEQAEQATTLWEHPSLSSLHQTYEKARYSKETVSESEYHDLKRKLSR
ncbi:MAG: hypothetical protein E7256_16775 [Lachnospiraceae bacterium]|nr:hypothetical protein [Lachnospiraceae bacterium]